MAARVLQAIGEIALHLPEVRRDPLGALDLLTPDRSAPVLRDLAYGSEDGQRLDLYLPQTPARGAPKSAVLFFHGGRWSYGRKEEYRFVAEAFGALGHAVAVCDYRKYPVVRFPAFVEDAAAAVAWALANLPGHGIDPRLVFAMGHSAGAHMASLATMDRRYGARHGIDPDRVAGLVLMSGPFDFYPIRGADLRDIFGPEEGHADTQPLRFVRRGLPPMLFLHGRRDRTVRPVSSARMASAVREHGGDARTVFYDFLTHTSILGGLSHRVGFLLAPILDDISRFLTRRITELTSPEKPPSDDRD
ncbi:MAG: alpha/beta hydrolase [Candidatus Binatia bacterium]